MKKLLILSTVISALSLAHSVNTYTEYKYDNASKVALGSDLKLDFKNITGETKIKFGEFGFEDTVFLGFQKNIDFKNEYNARLNVSKNVDLLGKVKFDVEKRENDSTISYEVEPAVEISKNNFKFLLGLNEKGTKTTFDTGLKLGLDYSKAGFENKLRVGAWYLVNRSRNERLLSTPIVNDELMNELMIASSASELLKAVKTPDEILGALLYSGGGETKGVEKSRIYVPFEISAVDNINYTNGKFETKNEINVNYVSNDLYTKFGVPATSPRATEKEPVSANQKNLENTLKVKVKSENSYKATDTLTPKFNVENEYTQTLTGGEVKANVKHTEIAVENSKLKLAKVSFDREDTALSNKFKNSTDIKLALNYSKQIDSQNKFSVEPSLKTNITYSGEALKNTKSVVSPTKENAYVINATGLKDKKVAYTLEPKIEATYENKINDNLTFSLKPYIGLKFAGEIKGGDYETYQLKADGKVVDAILTGTSFNDKQKEIIKKGEKLTTYSEKGLVKTPFTYNSVTAGAKLELNYTW